MRFVFFRTRLFCAQLFCARLFCVRLLRARLLCVLLGCLLPLALTAEAHGSEPPRDLLDALPEEAEDILEIGGAGAGPEGFTDGIQAILDSVSGRAAAVFRQRIRGAASILLVVV